MRKDNLARGPCSTSRVGKKNGDAQWESRGRRQGTGEKPVVGSTGEEPPWKGARKNLGGQRKRYNLSAKKTKHAKRGLRTPRPPYTARSPTPSPPLTSPPRLRLRKVEHPNWFFSNLGMTKRKKNMNRRSLRANGKGGDALEQKFTLVTGWERGGVEDRYLNKWEVSLALKNRHDGLRIGCQATCGEAEIL